MVLYDDHCTMIIHMHAHAHAHAHAQLCVLHSFCAFLFLYHLVIYFIFIVSNVALHVCVYAKSLCLVSCIFIVCIYFPLRYIFLYFFLYLFRFSLCLFPICHSHISYIIIYMYIYIYNI